MELSKVSDHEQDKIGSHGSIERYKVRLVDQGFSHMNGHAGLQVDILPCHPIRIIRLCCGKAKRPKPTYVTESGKTLHMGFFAKIAIAIYMNCTTLELTLLQV